MVFKEVYDNVQNLNDNFTGVQKTVSLLTVKNEKIKVREGPSRITIKRLDGTTLFWDSDIQGNWDEFNWAGDDPDDGYTTPYDIYIFNNNNLYIEHYTTTDYIDESVDVTLSNSYATFQPLGYITSTIIAKEPNKSFSSVSVSVYGKYVDNIRCEISFDNGSTWYEVPLTNQESASGYVAYVSGSFSITNPSSQGIRYKLTNTNDTQTVYVDKIEVLYQ